MKEKILVIAPQFLGDGILSVPFFRNLRLHYKDAQIDAITKNAGKLVLDRVPYINNVYDLKNITKSFIRKQKYKKVYILKRSLSAMMLVLGCGIKQKIGFSGQFRKPFLSKPVKYKANQKHEIEHFFDILRSDGIEIVDNNLEYFVLDEACKSVQKHLSECKKALLVPCASTKVKQWSNENFAKVAEFLLEQGYSVYFLGLKSEKAYCDSIAKGEGIYNLCGKLSFDESVALVSQMDLAVGIDSGFCHLASAFEVKTLTLFGPMSPLQWGLWGEQTKNFWLGLPCSPCKKPKKCKINFECMQKITPENVLSNLSDMI
ncbi:MAG: glycosyltransferase family 9 protein [bacterium]